MKKEAGISYMISKFWIYENWKTNGYRARIHKSTCKHCGIEGEKPKESMQGSAWRGPFDSLQESIAFAKQLGAKVSVCKLCLKSK